MNTEICVEKLDQSRLGKYQEVYAKARAQRHEIQYQVIIIWYDFKDDNFKFKTAFFSERHDAEEYQERSNLTYDILGYYHTVDLIYIGNVG